MKTKISKQIIYLIGLPGVGKTTVATEISKKTGFALLDNHLTYKEVCRYLPPGTKEAHLLNGRLHLAILKMLLLSNIKGVVCTVSIRHQPTKKICKQAVQLIEKLGHSVNFIKLKCKWNEHKHRVVSPSRKQFTKTNTLKKLKEKMTIPIFKGLNTHEPLIIDNTKLSAKKCAEKIISVFNLT